MVVWVQPTNTTNRIVTTTLLGIAQVATFFRLGVRIRTKRFWLDDTWSIVALICSFMLLVDMWIRTDMSKSKDARIVAYWMVSLSFTNTLWSSRMSIIFSVIRLIPHHSTLRKVTNFFAGLFALMWAGLLIQKVYICASDKSWYKLDKPQCHLGTGVASMELITDLIADLVLAIIPATLLRNVMIAGSQRKMLFIIFAASLLTTLASIVHAVYLLGPTGLLEAITAQAEAAVALLVADAGVVVTSIYRLIQSQSDIDSKPYAYSYSIQSNGIMRMHRAAAATNCSVVSGSIAFVNPSATTGQSETLRPNDSIFELEDKPKQSVSFQLNDQRKGHTAVFISTDVEQTHDSHFDDKGIAAL